MKENIVTLTREKYDEYRHQEELMQKIQKDLDDLKHSRLFYFYENGGLFHRGRKEWNSVNESEAITKCTNKINDLTNELKEKKEDYNKLDIDYTNLKNKKDNRGFFARVFNL